MIPVVCSILAIVILMFGVTYHVQQRPRFTTEIAEFDFHENQEELSEMTFWQRLKQSLSVTFRSNIFTSCAGRNDELLNQGEPGYMTDHDVDEGFGPSQEIT